MKSSKTGGAEMVIMDIDMGVGELVVESGADALLEAEFIYNVDDWEPELSYDVDGDEGRLTIKQPDSNIDGIPNNGIEYEWRLDVADDVPLEMEVSLGAGESNLDLQGLQLERLNV